MGESTGDAKADAALAELARDAPGAAEAARAGFESLTWGEGLSSVTAHGLADFLWYQLPLKWVCDLDEKLQIATALGDLFIRLDKPRYASMCHAPATAEILTTYAQQGEQAGVKAFRKALTGTGVEPPDVPGVFGWGSVMGTDEATAYWLASSELERAIDAGELTVGGRGWRTAAQRITHGFLDSRHDDVTSSSWLQWLHTERLQRWTESRGPIRARLTDALADQLTNPLPAPACAEQHLAPVRWLLDHAAEGAPLTQTGNLARDVVADGCQRFGWLTTTGSPRSESDIAELRRLRELAAQQRMVRRSGRRLLLSRYGRTMQAAATDELWQATMSCLPGHGDGEAAAGEVALILLLSGELLGYQESSMAVGEILAEEGWHSPRTGQPVGPDQAAALLATLRGRLWLFGLEAPRPLGEPLSLNDAGYAAAHTALRGRALRPRTRIYP